MSRRVRGGRGRGSRGGSSASLPQNTPYQKRDKLLLFGAVPEPTYPPLEFQPAELLLNEEYEAELAIKHRISSYFRTSNYFLKGRTDSRLHFDPNTTGKGLAGSSGLTFDWECLPEELRPNQKRKRKAPSKNAKNAKRMKIISENSPDINPLEVLEKMETAEATDTPADLEESAREGKLAKGEGEGEGDEEEEEVEDEDLEDIEDDYVGSYFDNGEGYLDEDDGLDEGPSF